MKSIPYTDLEATESRLAGVESRIRHLERIRDLGGPVDYPHETTMSLLASCRQQQRDLQDKIRRLKGES